MDLTHDASDDGFHEIQLSGKQLVFLFMATTVVSVVIFLCGVLVGRGVRAQQILGDEPTTNPPLAAAPASTDTVADAGPAAVEPPSPPAESSDPALTAKTPAPQPDKPPVETAAPPPAPAEQPKREEPKREEPRRATPEPVATSAPAPAPTSAPPPAATRTARGAQGSSRDPWVVQIVALRDRSRGQLDRAAPERQGLSGVRRQPDGAARPRLCSRCRSGVTPIATRPSRSRGASKKKNSSSPGSRASRPVGRPPGAQLPEVRPPRVRVGGLDAPCRRRRTRRGPRPLAALTAPSCSVCSPAASTSPGRSTGWSRR